MESWSVWNKQKKKITNKKNKAKLEMAVKRLIDPKQMGSLFKVLTVTNEN